MTTIYFCKLCNYESSRERDVREHLFYNHRDELWGMFEVNDDEWVMLPERKELLLA